jgi:hypothetical protein
MHVEVALETFVLRTLARRPLDCRKFDSRRSRVCLEDRPGPVIERYFNLIQS